jgi:hypothetical protein
MTTLNTNTLKELYLAKIFYEIHVATEKLSFFTSKHDCTFLEFENKIQKSSKENFEDWDDYLEWKAYNNFFNELKIQKQDLENGNIKVA